MSDNSGATEQAKEVDIAENAWRNIERTYHVLAISAIVSGVLGFILITDVSLFWAKHLHDTGLVIAILSHLSEHIAMYIVIFTVFLLIYPAIIMGVTIWSEAKSKTTNTRGKRETRFWSSTKQIVDCLQKIFERGKEKKQELALNGVDMKSSNMGSESGVSGDGTLLAEEAKCRKSGTTKISKRKLRLELLFALFIVVIMSVCQGYILVKNYSIWLFVVTALIIAAVILRFKIVRTGRWDNAHLVFFYALLPILSDMILFLDVINNANRAVIMHHVMLVAIVACAVEPIAIIAVILLDEINFPAIATLLLLIVFIMSYSGIIVRQIINFYGGERSENYFTILYDAQHTAPYFTMIDGDYWYDRAKAALAINQNKKYHVPGYWCMSRIYTFQKGDIAHFACQSNIKNVNMWGTVLLGKIPRPNRFAFGFGMLEPSRFKHIIRCVRVNKKMTKSKNTINLELECYSRYIPIYTSFPPKSG